MITKSVTYTNPFTEREVERLLYFGLTQAEVVELQADWAPDGGIEGRLDTAKRGEDIAFIKDTFQTLIARSYGERHGEDFQKNSQIRDAFLASEAYSIVFMALLQSPEPEWDAAEFIKGVLPGNMTVADASMTARQRSEANMQGHNQKQVAAPKSDDEKNAEYERYQADKKEREEREQFEAWKRSQEQGE